MDREYWARLYNRTPLRDVPLHWANMRRSPFLMDYLATVLCC